MLVSRAVFMRNSVKPPGGQEGASRLELFLITFALVVSTLLSLLPSSRDRARTRGIRTSRLVRVVSLISAACALALATVTTILAWLGQASLDAFAGVVFVLVPALVAMPVDLIQDVFYRFLMRKHPSLNVREAAFSYVRIGARCGSRRPPRGWRTVFAPDALRLGDGQDRSVYLKRGLMECTSECSARIFIRYSPVRGRRAVVERGIEMCRSRVDQEDLRSDTQWFGTRIGHSKHCIVLRDHNHGLKFGWWICIISASWLVATPSLVRLEDCGRMVNALGLLADIVRVGDLILSIRRKFIQWQLCVNEGVRKGLTATPGCISNLILSQIGLNEWGNVSGGIRQPSYEYPINQATEYGLLFFILTEKSHLYADEIVQSLDEDGMPLSGVDDGDQRVFSQRLGCYVIRKKRKSANFIIDHLLEAQCTDDLLMQHIAGWVDSWLVSWGVSRKSLHEFHQLQEASSPMEESCQDSSPRINTMAHVNRFCGSFRNPEAAAKKSNVPLQVEIHDESL